MPQAFPALTVITPERFPSFSPHIDEVVKILEAASFEGAEVAVFPGFCDVHVHLREPGFSYKETIATGTKACARGGFTDVCAMPNLDPVPDTLEALALEEQLIEEQAVVRVYPYGSVTRGEAGQELSDIEALGERVIGFSDDGKGVQSEEMMREAMARIATTGRPIATHSEIESIKADGYINDGEYARLHGHRGIPKEAEWRQIERDIELARETGVKYHICHVSCAESVELVRRAKADGVDITCETAPHYLILSDADLVEDSEVIPSGHFKMNPPLRSPEDRAALVAALADGTIDIIATDHAPHSAEEKARGLEGSAFGIVGIETVFQLMYTEFVKTGIITLDRLLELLVIEGRERFGLPMPSERDFTVWDLSARGPVDPSEFESLGHATPFAGREVYGRCLATVVDGQIAWLDPRLRAGGDAA